MEGNPFDSDGDLGDNSTSNINNDSQTFTNTNHRFHVPQQRVSFSAVDSRRRDAGLPSGNRSLDAGNEGRGMSAWFAELYRGSRNGETARQQQQQQRGTSLGDDLVAHAVEVEGDAEFARRRAPLFEKVKQPHQFSPDERARMDKYESIDYAEPHSFLHKSQVADRLWRTAREQQDPCRGWLRWVMFIAIGIAVGLWAVLLFQSLDFLAEVKLASVQDFVGAQQRAHERRRRRETPNSATTLHGFVGAADGSGEGEGSAEAGVGLVSLRALVGGYGVFALWSVVAAMLSSLCCVVMPSAAGSGIPDVMAYLNGIMFPRIFNIRNLVTKTLSCLLAVSAGLPVGTEGPIIHIGSLIGAGLPTGRSRSLHCSATSLFSRFRNAKDERDFISAGAACGLTAAFSSPLGGMLFVLEEIATFFSVRLAWMVLVSCLSCMCVTQYVNTHLSGWRPVEKGEADGSPALGDFRDSSIAMLYLGTVRENRMPMNLLTVFPTVVVAVVAAGLAVSYTVNSIRLSRWRTRRLFPRPVFRVLEPGVFALVFATACYAVPLLMSSSCQIVPEGLAANQERLNVHLVTAFCKVPKEAAAAQPARRYYHPLATLTMTNPYNLLRLLLSRQTRGLFPSSSLLLHLVLYTAGSSYAGGMFISCGTVIPSLLIGAVTGRLVGELFPLRVWADPGVLALVGAAAYFSGISRLTFSLIVIMMELTADLTHVTCLMLAVIVAKGIADRYCHSLYASTLEVKAAPLLEVQTSIHEYDTFSARDIATSPVVTLSLTETVVHVLEVLHATKHNAFPVVSPVDGTYVGMITRAQLQHLLWLLCFRDEAEEEGKEEKEVQAESEGGRDLHGSGESPRSRRRATTTTTTANASAATTTNGGMLADSSVSQRQQRRERWLSAQPHATSDELAEVKEAVFWERLPAMPPPGFLPMDISQSFLDLSPYVDLCPYYVLEVTCVSRTYYLFRHLGLRHLPVLDRRMRVEGILTRTNFVGDRLQERAASAAGLASSQQRRRGFFGHHHG